MRALVREEREVGEEEETTGRWSRKQERGMRMLILPLPPLSTLLSLSPSQPPVSTFPTSLSLSLGKL